MKWVCLMLLIIISTGQVYADMTAEEIAAKLTEGYPTTFTGQMEMIRHKPDKEERVSVFDIWADGKKSLIRFVAPVRERGVSSLKLEDDMYMYLPQVGRVMRISGRQRVLDSDFSSADILGIDLAEDYNVTLEGSELIEETDYYVLLFKAKSKKVTYNTVKVWVSKDKYLPLMREYYTTSGKLLQVLEYSNYQPVGEIVMPMTMKMYNTMVGKEQYTIVTYKELKIDQKIPSEVFTLNFLEREF